MLCSSSSPRRHYHRRHHPRHSLLDSSTVVRVCLIIINIISGIITNIIATNCHLQHHNHHRRRLRSNVAAIPLSDASINWKHPQVLPGCNCRSLTGILCMAKRRQPAHTSVIVGGCGRCVSPTIWLFSWKFDRPCHTGRTRKLPRAAEPFSLFHAPTELVELSTLITAWCSTPLS